MAEDLASALLMELTFTPVAIAGDDAHFAVGDDDDDVSVYPAAFLAADRNGVQAAAVMVGGDLEGAVFSVRPVPVTVQQTGASMCLSVFVEEAALLKMEALMPGFTAGGGHQCVARSVPVWVQAVVQREFKDRAFLQSHGDVKLFPP